MTQAAEIWKKVIEMLSKKLTPTTMNTFFEGTEGVDITGSAIAVSVRSVVAREAIATHYINMIEECLFQLFSVPISCILLSGEEELNAFRASQNGENGLWTTNEFTFSNFVVGPSNRFDTPRPSQSQTTLPQHTTLFSFTAAPAWGKLICCMLSQIKSERKSLQKKSSTRGAKTLQTS